LSCLTLQPTNPIQALQHPKCYIPFSFVCDGVRVEMQRRLICTAACHLRITDRVAHLESPLTRQTQLHINGQIPQDGCNAASDMTWQASAPVSYKSLWPEHHRPGTFMPDRLCVALRASEVETGNCAGGLPTARIYLLLSRWDGGSVQISESVRMWRAVVFDQTSCWDCCYLTMQFVTGWDPYHSRLPVVHVRSAAWIMRLFPGHWRC